MLLGEAHTGPYSAAPPASAAVGLACSVKLKRGEAPACPVLLPTAKEEFLSTGDTALASDRRKFAAT